jgi:hypothetical protein
MDQSQKTKLFDADATRMVEKIRMIRKDDLKSLKSRCKEFLFDPQMIRGNAYDCDGAAVTVWLGSLVVNRGRARLCPSSDRLRNVNWFFA